jgi:hypothetical protein
MLMKFLPVAAAAAALTLATAASAATPAQLSDSEMDGITAGAFGIANAASLTFGEVISDTLTHTSTNVNVSGPRWAGPNTGWVAEGQSLSQALAVGGFLFNAAAASHADSAASL